MLLFLFQYENVCICIGEGYWSWNYVMDCFETTVCTDRSIPSSGDGDTMTDTLFNATIAQVEAAYAYRALYNNSWWSKLAMATTVLNIKNRIEAALNGDDDSYQFVVYAAHDTTIMPLLGNFISMFYSSITYY